MQPEKLSSIEDRGQTDRITVLPRTHTLYSAPPCHDMQRNTIDTQREAVEKRNG